MVTPDTKASTTQIGRPRPNVLRALGKNNPPTEVTVDGKSFRLLETYKHDSWAATALYGCDNQRIICKFNRQKSIGLIPMGWLGRTLAHREHAFLSSLAGVEGIPEVFANVSVSGRIVRHAVAHEFIPGRPLSLASGIDIVFFESLEALIATLHDHRIGYVDLHKQENVIVGDDGKPYLIDFQVSLRVPNWRILNPLFHALRDLDEYHIRKHRCAWRIDKISPDQLVRPWWLNMHRRFAVPLRTFRRRFLVLIGVRRGYGSPATEIAPEIGLRKAAG